MYTVDNILMYNSRTEIDKRQAADIANYAHTPAEAKLIVSGDKCVIS